MLFPNPLIKGTLLKRYKRFLADVELNDGQVITAHCPNTGAMTGCAEPGNTVWLSPSANPKRKLPYTWELSVTGSGDWIGVNTNNANKLVVEAIQQNRIAQLTGYSELKTEVKYGIENSRIDILLEAEDKSQCYVEVKSVTLLDNGKGYFPDAKTVRGSKHLRELSQLAADGKRAVLFYCVQHTGINNVSVAQHIDDVYADTLQQAIQSGVEVMVYDCAITEEKIQINQALDFILQKKG